MCLSLGKPNQERLRRPSHESQPLPGCVSVVGNQQPCSCGACSRQTGANHHNETEPKYKCFSNRLSDGGCGTWVETGRQLQAGEFDLARLNVVECVGREREVRELGI